MRSQAPLSGSNAVGGREEHPFVAAHHLAFSEDIEKSGKTGIKMAFAV